VDVTRVIELGFGRHGADAIDTLVVVAIWQGLPIPWDERWGDGRAPGCGCPEDESGST
jgi:hypothetical protein